MSCHSPLRAFPIGKWPSGKVKYKICDLEVQAVCRRKNSQDSSWFVCEPDFSDWNYEVVTENVLVPCGQCLGCRLNYSREWANRMLMELPYHDSAYFLTLTYDNQHVPYSYYYDSYSDLVSPVLTLKPRDLELFWKRLRKARPNANIRYFACGEYGTETWRPHYHAIVFSLELNDLVSQTVVRGNTYYTSDFLASIWQNGHVLIGDVTWQSCAYVARYVVKKAKGYNADLYRAFGLEPEFVRMSRKPGLGRWFYDDHPDLYDTLSITISTPDGGKKFRPPRYFDKLLEADDPTRYENIKAVRREVADSVMNMILSKTDLDLRDYLQVQEELADNKIKKLLRSDI